MSKEERQTYDNYIDTRRYIKGVFETALDDKIKQLEDKHSKEFQVLAKLLLENGVSKEEILAQTGIKL